MTKVSDRILMILLQQEIFKKRTWRSRNSPEERRRRDRRVPRPALPRYRDSAFKKLYESKNDQALLNACAVDHAVFEALLDFFEPA